MLDTLALLHTKKMIRSTNYSKSKFIGNLKRVDIMTPKLALSTQSALQCPSICALSKLFNKVQAFFSRWSFLAVKIQHIR